MVFRLHHQDDNHHQQDQFCSPEPVDNLVMERRGQLRRDSPQGQCLFEGLRPLPAAVDQPKRGNDRRYPYEKNE